MYEITQLENGLRVATAAMPHMSSVSLGIWVAAGSRYERPELNGASHFIEHLLFKGTRRRTAREISEAVEGIGGYLNAFTSEEATCIHARAPHSHFPELMEVLADMALHSRFAPEDVRKEREVIKEEIAMYLDEPQHHVQELLNEIQWPNQPLGRPISGTNASLNGITRRNLWSFWQSFYTAPNCVVAVAGRITHRQAVKAARQNLRRFRRGPRNRFAPVAASQSSPQIRLFTKQTEQTQIALGIRACSRHDSRRFALRLLNTLLGENMSSRLFQVVREEHALAYSIYSTPSFFSDTGDIVISAGLETNKVPRALRLIVKELKRFQRQPPGRHELRRAQEYIIGQMDLSQESTDSQMTWVGEQLLGFGRVFRPAEIKRRLLSVTPAEIRQVASDFILPQNLNLALVSPLRTRRNLVSILN